MRRLLAIAVLTLVPTFAFGAAFDDIRLYATGGKSMTNWHGQADVQALHFELGHKLSPRYTVAMVIAPMTVWQPRSWFGDLYGDGHEAVHAMAVSLLGRRTFHRQNNFQWFVEASSGPMVAEERIPAGTSHFNFASAAGVGFVLNPNGRYPVIAGYRFMHISNGGYAPRNPGLNVSEAVLGVQLRMSSLRRR